eukprot:Rmarinus@m.3712
MTVFGKTIQEVCEQDPEWKDHYVAYNQLKDTLERIRTAYEEGVAQGEHPENSFVEELDSEVRDCVDFYLSQERKLLDKLEDLERRHPLSDERDIDEDIGEELAEGYRELSVDLVHLLHYVHFNATAIRKILKKHDKIARMASQGWSTVTSDYLQRSLRNRDVVRFYLLEDTRKIITKLRVLMASQEGRAHANIDLSNYAHMLNEIDMATLQVEESVSYTKRFFEYLSVQAIACDSDGSVVQTPLSVAEMRAQEAHMDRRSLFLIFLNTFLYMMNYYIVIPSTKTYASALGADDTTSGVIIGATPIAAMGVTVLYSWLTNRSFFPSLFCSGAVLAAGNILYGLAWEFRSLTLVVVGRLLCGMGSARAVNRRYITDTVPSHLRTREFAMFVAAGALGMAVGPAAAIPLHGMSAHVAGLDLREYNVVGYLMACIWVVFLILLVTLFREPTRRLFEATDSDGDDEEASKPLLAPPTVSKGATGSAGDISLEGLPRSAGAFEPGPSRPAADGAFEGGTDGAEGVLRQAVDQNTGFPPLQAHPTLVEHKPRPSDGSIPATFVCFFIYFALKMMQEGFVSCSPLTTGYYFGWGEDDVGFFLMLLGLSILPINYVVGVLSHRFEFRQIILVSETTCLIGLLLMLVYGDPESFRASQFIVGGSILFISTQILEGMNMSLFSRVMPSSWMRGIFNAGFLATEAGTGGRALGNLLITVAGESVSMENVENVIMGVLTGISILTVFISLLVYPRLVPVH